MAGSVVAARAAVGSAAAATAAASALRAAPQRRPRSAQATSREIALASVDGIKLASANVVALSKLTSTPTVRPAPRDVPSAPAPYLAIARARCGHLPGAHQPPSKQSAIGPPFHPTQATKIPHAPPTLPARRYAMDGPSAEPPMNAEEMEEGSFMLSTGAAHLPRRQKARVINHAIAAQPRLARAQHS